MWVIHGESSGEPSLALWWRTDIPWNTQSGEAHGREEKRRRYVRENKGVQKYLWKTENFS
jgi:hypothetical protein